MPSYSIRAVVAHLGVAPSSPEEYKDLAESAASKLYEALDKINVRPDSVRITFPNGDPRVAAEAAPYLGEVAESEMVLISLGGVEASRKGSRDFLAEAAGNGVYAHALLDEPTWEVALELARTINGIAELEPVKATRIGVNALGRPVLTPYYPLSSSRPGETGVSAAVTYPNALAKAYQEGGIPALEREAARIGLEVLGVLREIASAAGFKAYGVDLSVSPWMQETSLGLVELVAGTRIPEPGFARGVLEVNKALARAAQSVGESIGFNEVQLPVAEDQKLKLRAAEGVITASDLARLSGVCLAGLDMAVVPYDERRVAGLILEVSAYAETKGKPLGVRLVPLQDVEPGDKVDLGAFGETPVIAL
ncbi:DUF711 family protein [Stetteria hydrogenophila]